LLSDETKDSESSDHQSMVSYQPKWLVACVVSMWVVT